MKKSILLLFISIILKQGIAQDKDLISDLTNRLESFYSNNSNERVYIQTDKAIYSPGENCLV